MSYEKKTRSSWVFYIVVMFSAIITMIIMGGLFGYILLKGLPNLTKELFEREYTSVNVSMFPAIINTLRVILLALFMVVPIGVGAAIYMVEYAKRGNSIVKWVRLTTETLAGIPSIVYGLFGYLMFVMALDMGYSLLAGALTLAIMVLPTIMRTTEEALKSVPDTYREGSYGLGAGRLRTVFHIVLAPAMPGIISGIILSIGRMIGETAALVFTASTVPQVAGIMDSGRTLAVHMYCLMTEGLYTEQAYGTAVILMVIVAVFNQVSGYIARKVSIR